MDDDTIREVELNNNIQLEAIAEEVAFSWRLKEVTPPPLPGGLARLMKPETLNPGSHLVHTWLYY